MSPRSAGPDVDGRIRRPSACPGRARARRPGRWARSGRPSGGRSGRPRSGTSRGGPAGRRTPPSGTRTKTPPLDEWTARADATCWSIPYAASPYGQHPAEAVDEPLPPARGEGRGGPLPRNHARGSRPAGRAGSGRGPSSPDGWPPPRGSRRPPAGALCPLVVTRNRKPTKRMKRARRTTARTRGPARLDSGGRPSQSRPSRTPPRALARACGEVRARSARARRGPGLEPGPPGRSAVWRGGRVGRRPGSLRCRRRRRARSCRHRHPRCRNRWRRCRPRPRPRPRRRPIRQFVKVVVEVIQLLNSVGGPRCRSRRGDDLVDHRAPVAVEEDQERPEGEEER